MPAARPPAARPALRCLPVALALLLGASPALAQPGWGHGGWDRGGWDQPPAMAETPHGEDAREGRLSVERFPAEGATARLGHGAIAVAPVTDSLTDGGEQAVYEAAVIDRLVKAGYETRLPAAAPAAAPSLTPAAPAPSAAGQVVEVRVEHAQLVPEEQKKNPVSGAMEMGVSNRGSMMGLAINIDMTKPKKALIQTRMAVRIRDAATGAPLWEGRALIATREEDARWPRQTIAETLAGALFHGFPGARD